jgi:predicted PurR-regulated permease PerM
MFLFVLSSLVGADARDRLSALEKELNQVKNEMKELVKSLASRESASFKSVAGSITSFAESLLGQVRELGVTLVAAAKAYLPVVVDQLKNFSKDLPGYSQHAFGIVEKQARSSYAIAYQFLSEMLSKQGVPKDYVNYVTMGVLFTVGLAVLLITFTIISSILSAIFSLLCCRSKKSATSSKKKKNKAPQPNQHA